MTAITIACLISTCSWVLQNDESLEERNVALSPGVASAMGVPLDAFLSIRNAQLMQRNEYALDEHFRTHSVLEWVTDLVAARALVEGLTLQLAELCNVSRETLHTHDASWVDPLLFSLGDRVAAWASPTRPGDEPVAVGSFVHVRAEGSLDRDATLVIDDAGSVHELLLRNHHFSFSKG